MKNITIGSRLVTLGLKLQKRQDRDQETLMASERGEIQANMVAFLPYSLSIGYLLKCFSWSLYDYSSWMFSRISHEGCFPRILISNSWFGKTNQLTTSVSSSRFSPIHRSWHCLGRSRPHIVVFYNVHHNSSCWFANLWSSMSQMEINCIRGSFMTSVT